MQKDRMRTFLRFVCLVLFVCARSAIANNLEAEEIAKPALDATVLLVMYDENGELSTVGSGFFVKKDIIATNFHVIEGATEGIAKRVGQKLMYSVEELLNHDEENDLAILKVSAPDVKPLFLGDSDSVRIGQTIYVAGNPQGFLEGTFSDGIISAIRGDSANRLLQLTAPISEGSSGGPVLNDKGEVVGVSVATWKYGQNLNFAIPSKYLRTLLIRSGISPPPKPKLRPDNSEARRKNGEKPNADVEKARANAEQAKAEAEKAKAEAQSAKKEDDDAVEPRADITKRLKAATVCIIGLDSDGKEALLGSGLFVRLDQVATDFHVVDGATLIGVRRFGQGAKAADGLIGARLLKTDKKRHLAILEVDTSDAQPLPFGNSAQINIGEKTFVVSDPFTG